MKNQQYRIVTNGRKFKAQRRIKLFLGWTNWADLSLEYESIDEPRAIMETMARTAARLNLQWREVAAVTDSGLIVSVS